MDVIDFKFGRQRYVGFRCCVPFAFVVLISLGLAPVIPISLRSASG